jgi:hypothetical protein
MHRLEIQANAQAGALVIRASGTMDVEGLRDAWRQTVRSVLKGDGSRALWDLTSASIEVSALEWVRLAAEDAPRDTFSVPVGLLVQPAHLQAVYDYADRLNRHGKICLGFDDRQDAESWLFSIGRVARDDEMLPCRLEP